LSKPPLIVVENRAQFRWTELAGEVITAEEFVAGADTSRRTVINLCRNYSYLGLGYYCSLLAEAWGQTVFPNVKAILRLNKRRRRGAVPDEAKLLSLALDRLPATSDALTLPVYCGRTGNRLFARLARALFTLFGCPLMLVSFSRDAGKWRLNKVKPLALDAVPAADDRLLVAALSASPECRELAPPAPKPPRFRLAVLHDANEILAPSKRSTIEHMAGIGHDLGVEVSIIGRRDLDRLPQFDGLFIRQTTSVENITFQFATAAERLGLPVIDDPASIVHCGNKVYLAGALANSGVRMPETRLVTRDTIAGVARSVAYPVVLKTPDGCFSTGVKRAEDPAAFRAISTLMLRHSDVILAQEFLYTSFDWRIGLLDGRPLFAARYHMCRGHWQIIRHDQDGSHAEGRTEAVPIARVPEAVLDAAMRAGRLIGNGLYGIDLKQNDQGVFVIEINDNPNIDVGLEDAGLGDALYRRLFDHFLDAGARRASAPFRARAA
jgi:glutathione synthase/RimK-type ligase-like ATP-grasp enzyme